MLFANNYNKYDIDYIREKYNVQTFDAFKIFFKKNFKTKLIFNSSKAEKMFINFVNFDTKFFYEKYENKIHQTLFNFFIYGKKFYFNSCHELYYDHPDKNKTHIKDCKCKIKVKNIHYLKIKTFLDLMNNKINTHLVPSGIPDMKKTIKIKNNSENKKIVSCFNELKEIGENLGIVNDANYIIDSVIETDTNFNTHNSKNNSKNNNLHYDKDSDSDSNNNNSDNNKFSSIKSSDVSFYEKSKNKQKIIQTK